MEKASTVKGNKLWDKVRDSRLFAGSSILIAITATTFGMLANFQGSVGLIKSTNPVQEEAIKQMGQQLNELNSKILDIETLSYKYLLNDSLIRNPDSKTALEIQELRQGLLETQKAVQNFEVLFITDAEKLISIPLLLMKIENIRNEITSEIKSVNDGLELQNRFLQEMQTQSRWIIGTLGLGILALIVPVVITTLGSPDKQKTKNK